MTPAEQEKVQLEHDAAKIFMRCYEAKFQVPIRHIWHNLPRKPDVSCYLQDRRLDMEIAHLYGSEQEAMKILGRELDEHTRNELLALEQTPADGRLLTALNRILVNKGGKSYRTERVWLVIRNAHPAWTSAAIAELQDLINVPNEHVFEQIWIVGDMRGETGILQLYPACSLSGSP